MTLPLSSDPICTCSAPTPAAVRFTLLLAALMAASGGAVSLRCGKGPVAAVEGVTADNGHDAEMICCARA